MAGIIPLTVGFSLLTFGDRVLFVNFLPSFAGVYLHYQVELHHELRGLRRHASGNARRVRWLEHELDRLRRTVAAGAPEAGSASGSAEAPDAG